MGHEPGQHEVLAALRGEAEGGEGRDEVGGVEGVGEGLDDDGFAGQGSDLGADGADVGADVVRGARAAVVDDVDHRGARRAGAAQEVGGGGESLLGAVQGHHAGAVGLLEIDHEEDGVGQPGQPVVQADHGAQRSGRGGVRGHKGAFQ